MYVIGTAGHVDHGKSTLVLALTGIDPDRLEEEKARQMTIDLGFAWLKLGEREVSIVDVPGHERFIKNMLAGVGGIDLVLFVIAADESIKPQTREHFDICRLLGIRGGIVALTKADLADPDILELARLEVEEFVDGSFLAGAPIVPVSSATGLGLDDLRRELMAAAMKVPAKDATGHFRLPIDRSFSARGFGTIVTGTLISGSVEPEDEVELHPSGRLLRVRGVQVYGAPAARATAGQRTAINLADIEPAEIERGMTLTAPRRFHPTRTLDCDLSLLPSAKPLKHRAPVHFHAGTAEIEAEVRFFGGRTVLAPGERAYARVVLRNAALLLPGDRFIIRKFSPVMTIGGGSIIDIDAPKFRAAVDITSRLDVLAAPHLEARVALLVRESRFGLSPLDLLARTGLSWAQIQSALKSPKLLAMAAPHAWVVDRAWFTATQSKILQHVRDFHRRSSLLPGIPKQDLKGRDLAAAPPFVFDALLTAASELAIEGEIVRLKTHRLVLKQDEEAARAAIEDAFEQSGLTVPAVAEVLSKSGVETARAKSLLQILIRERKLVRVADDLVFHQAAIAQLRGLLAGRKAERFSVGTFKDWTGVSRKYAIPLLEFLDRERITRRDGDERVVL